MHTAQAWCPCHSHARTVPDVDACGDGGCIKPSRPTFGGEARTPNCRAKCPPVPASQPCRRVRLRGGGEKGQAGRTQDSGGWPGSGMRPNGTLVPSCMHAIGRGREETHACVAVASALLAGLEPSTESPGGIVEEMDCAVTDPWVRRRGALGGPRVRPMGLAHAELRCCCWW